MKATSARRWVAAGALLLGILGPSIPAHAQSTWYWYYSPTGGGGCWNTSAGPSHGATAYQCDDPGSKYLPSSTIAGQTVQTSIGDGVWGNVDGHAAHSGDYCNSYDMTAFSGYVQGNPYYWGDPASGSYCYADGSTWGTNINPTGATAAGAQHFASVQGTQVFPWSFGTNPELYIYNQFGDFTNTSSSAWGYLCADLKDTGGAGDTLEICGDEWDWHRQAANKVGCFHPAGQTPTALPEDYFEPSGENFTTERSGSSNTVTSQTIARGTVFSMDITTQNLQTAITWANSWCSAQGTWSSNLAGYRLMGVEDGEELAQNTGDINGAEQALLFATLYG